VTYAESGSGSVGFDLGRPGWRTSSVETAELTHEDVRGQLSEFLADELDEAEANRVTAHLAQCPPCARYLTTLRATVDLLGTLPTRPAPDSLRQRLLSIPENGQVTP
jgi:anti-sigma factor RsiW